MRATERRGEAGCGCTTYPTMRTSEIPQLKEFTTAEKLLLVEDLWQEIAAEVEAAPLAPHVVHALEESAARYAVEPNEGSPWSEVRARVLAERWRDVLREVSRAAKP